MPGVIGHDCRLQTEAMGSNESVKRADRVAPSLKLMAYLPVCNGCGLIKRRDMELQQEAQQLLALGLRHGALYHHELQLREHDGRKHQPAVAQSVHSARDRLEALALVNDV